MGGVSGGWGQEWVGWDGWGQGGSTGGGGRRRRRLRTSGGRQWARAVGCSGRRVAQTANPTMHTALCAAPETAGTAWGADLNAPLRCTALPYPAGAALRPHVRALAVALSECQV